MKVYRVVEVVTGENGSLSPVTCVWEGPASCPASAMNMALGGDNMEPGRIYAVLVHGTDK